VSGESQIVIEISNGVIAIIGGLVLYSVNRIFNWVKSVNTRMSRIERKMDIDSPESDEHAL
jgi:tetrahydromethanopterin S-methyltransferase subunit B